MGKLTVREAALDVLLKVAQDEAFSHLSLNDMLKKQRLSGRDSRLLTEIVYGTMARRMTLDYYLAPFLKKSKKLEEWVRLLLHLSVYQMVYLDRVPDRAIIHEAVTIAGKRGHKGIRGFVNGVLRSVQRQGVPSVQTIADPLEKAAIETSHPKWLLARWVAQYGFDTAVNMAEANNKPPRVTVRVNVCKTNADEVIASLASEGVTAVHGRLLPEALEMTSGQPFSTQSYQKGLFTAQDESAMLVTHLLDIGPNMRVLDTCAAPGGKTTHIAEQLNGTGTVDAYDLHPHKVKLIAEQAARLGLTNVYPVAQDAREVKSEPLYDRILIDAPCTGFGVIRRKPDIRFRKQEADVKAIATVQQEILRAAALALAPGGKLVYSTCTIEQEENEAVVAKFLSDHPGFKVDETMKERLPAVLQEKGRCTPLGLTILPQDFGTDGFFMTCLTRSI
ncbi:16S rRNA (cytosine(967)-C(5))-methyltransferase RsmB [Shouchella lonarensis]|uniref:16S rRNA (cytosine(967)-C(5))-methyltransferase n=1 Tax=Shouchella lonarensis TaxID=1464122 RepID=A0A1G6L989_9BACI|nr:16S rRNA (cytosine(967)-C(5))-methyltransferase RsmB [Shouchella lonarensis]SDC39693.1 16S rRNA (cytosine967-C5)-methyltransferase [Shouchella lonarensis]